MRENRPSGSMRGGGCVPSTLAEKAEQLTGQPNLGSLTIALVAKTAGLGIGLKPYRCLALNALQATWCPMNDSTGASMGLPIARYTERHCWSFVLNAKNPSPDTRPGLT